MSDNTEDLVPHLLRELRADMLKGFQNTVEAFERVYVEIAEVKAEVVKCRADVAEADLLGKEVSVRLTLLEKRVKALEEARAN